MPTYYRVLLGRGNSFATECREGNFIGVDFISHVDFTGQFGADWRDFNRRYIPTYLQLNPTRTRIAAGLACASLYTFGAKMQIGDYVISPIGNGTYRIGQINDAYRYVPNTNLPHRRGITWLDIVLTQTQLSTELQNSIGSRMTVINLSNAGYDNEIKQLINQPMIAEQPYPNNHSFALEKHLEEFIVRNWQTLELGKHYDIYQDEDQNGQQYPIGNWYIDILAISKDKKQLLVIELKKGRPSDIVVGQILRYMGYVKESIAEAHQEVRGVIIAHEDDSAMRLALSMTPNVTFYRYHIQFSLTQGNVK
jgi:restriction system protein